MKEYPVISLEERVLFIQCGILYSLECISLGQNGTSGTRDIMATQRNDKQIRGKQEFSVVGKFGLQQSVFCVLSQERNHRFQLIQMISLRSRKHLQVTFESSISWRAFHRHRPKFFSYIR